MSYIATCKASMSHERIVTWKDCHMKRTSYEKIVTWKEFHKKRSSHEKIDIWKDCHMKRLSHEKIVIWKDQPSLSPLFYSCRIVLDEILQLGLTQEPFTYYREYTEYVQTIYRIYRICRLHNVHRIRMFDFLTCLFPSSTFLQLGTWASGRLWRCSWWQTSPGTIKQKNRVIKFLSLQNILMCSSYFGHV